MNRKLLLSFVTGVVLSSLSIPTRGQSHQSDSPVESRRALLARVYANANAPSVANLFGVDRITREKWSAGVWRSESRTDYVYSGVNRVERRDFQQSEATWVPTYRTTYYTNGMVQSIDVWDTISNSPQPQFQYYYEYSYDIATGRSVVSLVIEREWDGSDWHDRHRTTYEVENNPVDGPRVVGGRSDLWAFAEWDPVETFSVREEEGSVIQEFRSWDGTDWVNTDRILFPEHTIRSLADRLEWLAGRYGDFPDLQLALLMLPNHTIQTWTGTEWENSSRQVITAYHYVTGEPGIQVFEEWDGDSWVPTAQLDLSYALHNGSLYRVIRSSYQTPDEYGWNIRFVEDYSYDDRNLLVEAVSRAGSYGIFVNSDRFFLQWTALSVGLDDPETLPSTHVLRPAYPNPFNPTTTLTYEVRSADQVRLELRDMLGRLLAVLVDERKPAGEYEVRVNASDLPSGVYAVRMITPGFQQTRLLTLAK